MIIGSNPPAAKTDSATVAPGDMIRDTTTATFVKDVIEPSKQVPVLVDFWADWCGPCKQLTPLIEKVVRSYAGKVRLVKMNIDQHPTIPGQLGVQKLPTVMVFRDGRPIDGFMGVQPESAIKSLIDRMLGEDAAGDLAAALTAGDEAFEAGDLQDAAEIYASILEENREEPGALAGLARCYLKTGDVARAEQTIELVPPNKRNSPAVTAVHAALDLARKAAGRSGMATAASSKSRAGVMTLRISDCGLRIGLWIPLRIAAQRAPGFVSGSRIPNSQFNPQSAIRHPQ